MRGHDADSLVDAIDHLPGDSAATVDLRETLMVDARAARALGRAIDRRQRDGVEFAIVVKDPDVRAELAAAGIPCRDGAAPHRAFEKAVRG